MGSELFNALSNVIKSLKHIDKNLVEVYLHFHVKSWKSLKNEISNDFQDFTRKWRYTSTRSFAMGFKDFITFESALKRSDPIFFDYEMSGK